MFQVLQQTFSPVPVPAFNPSHPSISRRWHFIFDGRAVARICSVVLIFNAAGCVVHSPAKQRRNALAGALLRCRFIWRNHRGLLRQRRHITAARRLSRSSVRPAIRGKHMVALYFQGEKCRRKSLMGPEIYPLSGARFNPELKGLCAVDLL